MIAIFDRVWIAADILDMIESSRPGEADIALTIKYSIIVYIVGQCASEPSQRAALMVWWIQVLLKLSEGARSVV